MSLLLEYGILFGYVGLSLALEGIVSGFLFNIYSIAKYRIMINANNLTVYPF